MGRTCIKIDASTFDQALELQKRVQTSDGGGGFTDAWQTIKTIHARITPLSAFEKFQAGQQETPSSHKMTCRFDADIATDKRFVFRGSRNFDIIEVLDVEERQLFLNIRAQEGGAT